MNYSTTLKNFEMLTTDKRIEETTFKGLSVQKIFHSASAETLLITLEKDHDFPEHTSPRDALLVMLAGNIIFRIKGIDYSLVYPDSFTFPAKEPHKVHAEENSKFLIIR
jgi:quercetin dioxygenase-like cupin family protein